MTLGVILCAILSTYVVLIFIAILGLWHNNLLHFGENLLTAGILALGSLIGYAIRRLWIGNLIIGLGLLFYSVALFAMTRDASDYYYAWPVGLCIVAMPLLNSYFFGQWIKYFELSKRFAPE